MTPLAIFFWVCAVGIGYTCVGYPLLLALVNLFKRDTRALAPYTGSVALVVAARNEEENLERRLLELTDMLKASRLPGEVLVVSDGSTDQTAAIARAHAASGVRLLELAAAEGKAAALTAGSLSCTAEVLVFADARQRWARDALERLLENFADPRVGAVSGDLHLESSTGALAGIGFYWRFEKWLRRQESRLGSQVGVTGAISAVRRSLFRPIPPGTLLDDVYWPLQVTLQGRRVVNDPRARAFDRLPDNPRSEFQRKVRTLAGNFQLLTRLPAAFLPWRSPVWFQLISHKLLRLVVPWAMIGLLVSSLLLGEGVYLVLFWTQLACYGLALLGFTKRLGRAVPLAGQAASFLVLNAAAFVAFWTWISGRTEHTWRRICYSRSAD